MFGTDAASLRLTLQQLRQATQDHVSWHENLIRTIVCGLPCDPGELADYAHCNCRFGRWYYAEASTELRAQAVFSAMEAEHERVHRIAATLLRAAAGNVLIDSATYDEFMSASAGLRMELDSLRHEVQDILKGSDVLTGACGRGQLLPDLREWHEVSKRDLQRCCIAFMDLDHLKEINDTHGHIAGDQILAGAVRYITGHLRPYDKVFRYGGDEFLISLPGIELPDALHLVERISAGFGQQSFATSADGCPIRATASFGLTLLDPDVSIEESIDRADRALLAAKAAGRDRAICWDPGITTGAIMGAPPLFA